MIRSVTQEEGTDHGEAEGVNTARRHDAGIMFTMLLVTDAAEAG